ncbi:hypothetical protein AB1Y20_005658 [Prymnesium parvum]|uniref:Uncharacterized protein n=1 Tax=Prymnesium parvum TaxID=97485 RepID=A0AB34J5D2_PRYPA
MDLAAGSPLGPRLLTVVGVAEQRGTARGSARVRLTPPPIALVGALLLPPPRRASHASAAAAEAVEEQLVRRLGPQLRRELLELDEEFVHDLFDPIMRGALDDHWRVLPYERGTASAAEDVRSIYLSLRPSSSFVFAFYALLVPFRASYARHPLLRAIARGGGRCDRAHPLHTSGLLTGLDNDLFSTHKDATASAVCWNALRLFGDGAFAAMREEAEREVYASDDALVRDSWYMCLGFAEWAAGAARYAEAHHSADPLALYARRRETSEFLGATPHPAFSQRGEHDAWVTQLAVSPKFKAIPAALDAPKAMALVFKMAPTADCQADLPRLVSWLQRFFVWIALVDDLLEQGVDVRTAWNDK